MKNVKLRRALLALSALLLLIGGICLLRCHMISNLLESQKASERWQGEGANRFSQISCFMPLDEKLTPEKIYAFRSDMYTKLKDASFDIQKEKGLLNDAWSTSGRVKVRNGQKNGEVDVTAVGGSFFDFHPLRLLSGSYLGPDDLMQDRVLLDRETAWLLFGGTELTGMSFSINGVPFVVAGVYEHDNDRFSSKALGEEMHIYMSYSAYSALTENAGISCYELVIAEPVKNFGSMAAKEKFPIGNGEIVDNGHRYDFKRLFDLYKNRSSRAMHTGTSVYPHWENAARASEDACMKLLSAAVMISFFPLLFILLQLIRALWRGKTRLEEEIIPSAREKLEESVRVRQRARWEKKHPDRR